MELDYSKLSRSEGLVCDALKRMPNISTYASVYLESRLKEKEEEQREKDELKAQISELQQRLAASERERENANLENSYTLLRLSRADERAALLEEKMSHVEEKLATVCAWVAKQTTAETTEKKTTNIFSRYFTSRST